MKSPLTTLCYIEHDGCYLMMHRVCKENDENQDKWIGIGGHFEEGESPEECLLREVKEETGLTLRSFRFRGLVTFVSDLWGTEYMCLYTAKIPGDSAKDADFAEKIPRMGQTVKKKPEKCAAEMENSEPRVLKAEEIEGLVTDEGILEWVPQSEIENLNLWEGDKIFLRLLAENAPFFSLKLRYEGDELKEAVLDGKALLQKI